MMVPINSLTVAHTRYSIGKSNSEQQKLASIITATKYDDDDHQSSGIACVFLPKPPVMLRTCGAHKKHCALMVGRALTHQKDRVCRVCVAVFAANNLPIRSRAK